MAPAVASRSIIRCRARYRIPPRTRSRASTGTRCAHQRMWDGARPGQRGIWPASPAAADTGGHGRPSLRARRQSMMTLMRRRGPGPGRRQTARAARRTTASARRRGHRARRATPRVGPVSGKDCHWPCSTTGTDPDVAGPLRRRCPRLPTVSRLIGPERQVVSLASPSAQSVSLVLAHAE